MAGDFSTKSLGEMLQNENTLRTKGGIITFDDENYKIKETD